MLFNQYNTLYLLYCMGPSVSAGNILDVARYYGRYGIYTTLYRGKMINYQVQQHVKDKRRILTTAQSHELKRIDWNLMRAMGRYNRL